MSILSTNHRLISIGESYSAGSGIDITDQVISVTGDVMPYSAGDNIDIQDHVISGKDWTQDITDASSNAFNETTAWVHDNYANSADVSYLSGVVDNKLDASAWSSVSSNFATEDYVIMADNITYDRTTGYVENQQFAKESACQSAFEQLNTNKLDSSSFTDWQNGQYSTDLQTIEGQIANKLDSSSFSEVSGDFQPRGDYVERDTVYSAIESATSSKLDVSSFASVSSDFLTTEDLNGYATESFVENVSGDITALIPSDYATTTQINELSGDINYVSGQVDNKLDTTAFSDVSGTFLTAIDLSPYATTAEVDTLSSMLSGAIDYVSANAGDEFPISADEAIQYVENNSATINDVNTSYQTNSGTFLTAHQAISAEEWNDCYDNVNTNSGVWGGEALPISAGPGIKVNLVDNTLVFSNDETVLWSGADTTSTQTLSENITAFEEIKVYGKSHNFYPWISEVWINSAVVYGVGSQMYSIVPPEYDISRYCLSGDKITPMKGSWYTWANGTTSTTGDLTGNADQVSYICKVVGINRK